MALNRNELLQMMKALARADVSAPVAYSFNNKNYNYSALNTAAREALAEYAGTYALYRENKNLIFSIIEEVINDVLPKKVETAYAQFAETRVFAQGDKIQFRRKIPANHARAKSFITRVGLAGRYEVFKLGATEEVFQVRTSAVGGAARVGFEEFLDGRVDFNELINIVMEGINDLIYKEVEAAMKASVGQLPAANRLVMNGFEEDKFDTLVNVAAQYGTPTIYCTNEFAVKLVPTDGWRYTEAMKTELWNTGRLATYKGYKVVILPNGFKDETNSEKEIDPGYCWIIPTGANMKPVMIAFEGQAHVKETELDDWSRDFQVYQKVGVVAMLANNICCCVDTQLAGKMTTWHLNNNNIYYPNGQDMPNG